MPFSIYSSPYFYNMTMRLLYGKGFDDRYEKISNIIDDHSSVVDICCGDMHLYKNYLSKKKVMYTGIDFNYSFFNHAQKNRIKFLYSDVSSERFTPPMADYIIMQASLYHFLPDPKALVEKMILRSKVATIITEPVCNLASSDNKIIKSISKILSNPAASKPYHNQRFNNHSFKAFCDQFKELYDFYHISRKREVLAIFKKNGPEKKSL